MQAARNFSGAHIIEIPYDSGRRNFRMGNGPAQIAHQLTHHKGVYRDTISVQERAFELGTTFSILRAVSNTVRESIANHRLPILLAGGCLNSLGSLAALGIEATSLIWLDAHGDFNTPETTPSGFIDGMAIAAITGRCWRTLTASVPGFVALPEKNVLLIGSRDLDAEEFAALESSNISRLSTQSLRQQGIENTLREVLRDLPERAYVHLDLDVLDRSEARVNEYSCPGGLTAAELLEIIHFVGDNRAIVGASITAYDPSVDDDSKALDAAAAVVKAVLAGACIDVS